VYGNLLYVQRFFKIVFIFLFGKKNTQKKLEKKIPKQKLEKKIPKKKLKENALNKIN
jgi:hypothetical protein